MIPTTHVRMDDWANAASGVGTERDKQTMTYFARRRRMSRQTIEAIYTQSGIAARLVDRPTDDALREGWEIKNLRGSNVPTPAEVYRLAKMYGVDEALEQSDKWSRMYGGALIVAPIHDQRMPDTPARLSTASTLMPFRVVPAPDALPLYTDAVFFSPTYLQTLSFQVDGLATASVQVHHSRVIPCEEIALPPRALLEYNVDGWGPSIFERVYDELARDGAAAGHAGAMMHIASLLFTKIKGYREWFKRPGGPEEIQRYLSWYARNLSSLGITGVDADDDLQNLSLTTTNIHELLSTSKDRVAACADMPREILFNESPTGLRGGELSGPQALWYGVCGTRRVKRIEPRLRRVLGIIFAIHGYQVDGYDVDWPPLWVPDASESADVAVKNAQSDAAYMTEGVVTPAEVREHRVKRGDMGPLTVEASAEGEGEPLDISGAIEEPDIAAAAGAEKIADEAMNGAQIDNLTKIVEKVAAGIVPRDAGIAIISAAFPTQAHRAEAIMGSAGLGPASSSSSLAAGSAMPGAAEVDAGGAGPESPETAPDDLMSPRDIGARFGVPTRTITMAIERGKRGEPGGIRYWGLGPHMRVSLAEVVALAKSHEAPDDEAEAAE